MGDYTGQEKWCGSNGQESSQTKHRSHSGAEQGDNGRRLCFIQLIKVGGEQRAAVRNPRFEILFLSLGLFLAKEMN